MSLSRLLSASGLSKLLTPNLAKLDDAALHLMDKELLQLAKGTPLSEKAYQAYNKASTIGMLPNKAMYGSKLDAARLGIPSIATLGGITFGGAASKPFLHSLNAAYAKLAPTVAAKGAIPMGLNNLAMLKPYTAISTMPAMATAKALGAKSAMGLIAAHPYIAPLAFVGGGIGALKGAGKLMSRVGRRARIANLRKGIASKAYKLQPEQLRQLGLRH